LPEVLKEMNANAPSIGFVGGGRITNILLSALARNPGAMARAVVSDPDPEVRRRLLSRFPGVALGTENMEPARQDVVFLALHAPALRKALPEIAGALTSSAIVVSLAPVVTLAELSHLLGGFGRLVRMIPNAPSLVGDGFNPTTYSPALAARDRALLAGIFSAFGRSPEVAEVEDTVPVKPLADDEPAFANAYRTRLTPLYRKLTGKADA
jgi:pyrroline-5-carboxylate reductase